MPPKFLALSLQDLCQIADLRAESRLACFLLHMPQSHFNGVKEACVSSQRWNGTLN
jgi:hypothetical protein